MTDAETAVAVQQLHARYGQLVDDRRFEELSRLFCADAVWEAGPLRFAGRPAIVAGFEQIEPPRPGMVKHLTFAAVIERDGQDFRVWADAIALQIAPPGEPSPVVAAGRYHDVIRIERGQYRFAQRVFVYSGEPLPPGLAATPVPA